MCMTIYRLIVFEPEQNLGYTKSFSFDYSSSSEAVKAYECYVKDFLSSGKKVRICLMSLDYDV